MRRLPDHPLIIGGRAKLTIWRGTSEHQSPDPGSR